MGVVYGHGFGDDADDTGDGFQPLDFSFCVVFLEGGGGGEGGEGFPPGLLDVGDQVGLVDFDQFFRGLGRGSHFVRVFGIGSGQTNQSEEMCV